jgi:chromosome segregation ATPase
VCIWQMAGAAGSWEAKVLEMEGQLADAQKERDDFCAMVVDLETKLLASTAAKADDQRTKLEQRVWDLENSNAALGQSLSALEEQCSDYRQESERQRQKETSLTDEHLRLCEEHAELTRQLEECKLAQERVAEDATAALAAKDVDLGQLQVELGNAMTEGEARLEALIAAQARNEQLRQDLDNLHGALGVQTERAVKAESELATVQL